ncbi:MAG: 4Fe-4S binding protein [Euryarchaeota archaeon]|nr:4Fe-4S binding protein [Euryarchaeota archaeon]
MILVLEDWCKGCEICVKRCPLNALELSDKLNKRGVYPPKLKAENECNSCKLCELICPDFAVTVTLDEEKKSKEPKSRLIIGGIVNEV